MSFQALRLLNILRKRAEGVLETYQDGSRWQSVYVEGVEVKGITSTEKPGYLRALQQVGYYKKVDGYFGLVRMN